MDQHINLENVLENMTMGVVLIDDQEKIIYTNQLVTEITGYTTDQIKNITDWFETSFPEEKKREKVVADFGKNLENNNRYNDVFKIKTKTGEYKHIEFRVNLLAEGYMLINIIDVSDRIERKKEIKKIKERLEIAVKAANIGVWDWNIQTSKVYYNKNWAEMIGFKKEELENTLATWENLVHEQDKEKIESKLNDHFQGKDDLYICEHRLETKSGNYIWVKDIGKVIEKDKEGKPLRAIGVHINIDDSKKYEKKIEFLSFHDELTGLYNRRYLENEIERLSNSRKYPISIIIGDLDNFKNINDNHGHLMGDNYIKDAAQILKDLMRSEDIIARTGGDEFAIILPQTDNKATAKICERIREEFKKYNRKQEIFQKLSMSLGSCTLNNNSEDLNKAYDIADKKCMLIKTRNKILIKSLSRNYSDYFFI